MREYETVYIAQPQLTDAQISQLNTKLKGIIEKHDGKLLFARNMGKKNMAYRIKKQAKGIYYCLDYAAGGGCVNELERNLMLDENVLRFLTILKAEKIDIDARMAEIEARGEALQSYGEREVESKEKIDKPERHEEGE